MSSVEQKNQPVDFQAAPKAVREIYMDNAATSFPKPPSVEAALLHYHRHLGASAGRGAYPRAAQTGQLLVETRSLLAELFNFRDPRRLIFTLNASDALNLAIKGIDWLPGDVAVVSAMEHNSVIRPLHELEKRIGIRIVKVAANDEGIIDPQDVADAIVPRTRLISVLHASNVTGTIQPIADIGRIARSKGILFLVDAAQSAGAVPIDVEAMQIDLLAFPGHKALLGPLGTGGLYIREGLELLTLREGGTGSRSEQEEQPDFLPDRYEPGSHNALGIAGWKAGLEYVLEKGPATIQRTEQKLTEQFLAEISDIPGLSVYGPSAAQRVAVIPIRYKDGAPTELSEQLFERFGLMTRSGLHCAPGAHQTIRTYPIGTTRFSFGCFTTPEDVDHAITSLRSLT